MPINHFLKITLILFSILSSCTNINKNDNDEVFEALSNDFLSPPAYSRPGAFWCWLNGNMNREMITNDLREMSEKGMGRAEIWDVAAVNNTDNYIPAGPAFMSDSSVALIKHAFSEGKKYGIKIGMIGSSGWNAGGTWVEPEWASKALYFSKQVIQGPVKKSIALKFPEVPSTCPMDISGKPLFYKEVAVLAFPDSKGKYIYGTEGIINLTEEFSLGKVDIDLPEGNWVIMRFICSNNGQRLVVPSPNSNGLFIDFLDPKSTQKHLKHFMDRLGLRPGDSSEGGLAYIEFDSMELSEGIPWSDSIPQVFEKMHGYNIVDYLPVLSGWSIGEETERFRYDWKKTISDQLIFSHYITGRKFLNKYNIDLVAEAGGPGPPTWSTCPVDALKALGNVNVPRGEFWVQHRNIFLVKEVASASHIYGRNIVDAESFTTWRRWKDSPADLKKLADRAFAEGLNCVTFHTFASTSADDGLPGRTYHAGSDINHANTWWDKSKPFMDYLARCSYMLQQGLFVADVCYYYGDQAPNFYPAYHDVPEKPILRSLGKGYDFDVVNSDVILNRMSVEDGRIFLPDGLSYAVLVLPDQDDMPLNVLKKLETMVMEGATIVGRKPITVPGMTNYPEANSELSDIAEKMWAGIDGENQMINQYGKGRVIYGLTAKEVLSADMITMDFRSDNPGILDYIHRRAESSDIYFIRNLSDQAFSGKCKFRVSGKYPEIWDPSSGSQTQVKDYSDENGIITIELYLQSNESLFVVFNEDKRFLQEVIEYENPDKEVVVQGSWKIEFPEGWGAPLETEFDSLISWTDSDINGIKYFSGTATYLKTITLHEEDITRYSEIALSFGQVNDVAEVYVNGASAGILWKKPYVLNISALIQPGTNKIKVEVVNQWVNRLTGDMLLKPEDRFCKTNQPYITRDDMGYDNWVEGGDETFSLKSSGIFGPVIVRYIL